MFKKNAEMHVNRITVVIVRVKVKGIAVPVQAYFRYIMLVCQPYAPAAFTPQ